MLLLHYYLITFNANNIEEDKYQQPLQPLKYQYTDLDNNKESSIPIDDLHNNDKKILVLLSEEVWSTYSFKALERKLGIHQQSLSRALKRLEYLNLVEKTPHGYKIKGKNIFPLTSIIQNNQSEGRRTFIGRNNNKNKSKKKIQSINSNTHSHKEQHKYNSKPSSWKMVWQFKMVWFN